MNRRSFLRKAAASGLGSLAMTGTLTQLWSAPCFAQASSDYRAIVCLFLDGGADTNNVVIPADAAYNDYASNRAGLAVAKNTLNILKPTSSKRSFGLHPSLQNTASLYNAGEMAILANVGTIIRPTRKSDSNYLAEMPNNLFSHPSQIGAWSTAVSGSVAGTGWAGRVADALQAQNANSEMPSVVSTAGYQLIGQGANTNQLTAAASDQNTADLVSTLSQLQKYLLAAESGSAVNDIHQFVATQQQNALLSSAILANTFNAGSLTTTFPTSSVGQQLMLVAKLIAGRSAHSTKRQIFVVRDPLYDTHTNQLQTFADRMPTLDAGIASFVSALKEMGLYNSVTLFTCSDFGRSLVQNEQGGTDHGWGGHHMVIGGAVKGGDMYGTFPDLVPGGADDTNNLGIWIPTTGTTQYAATMANWLGVPASSLNTMFPELSNFSSQVLPLFG